jgi:phage gp46-like protein
MDIRTVWTGLTCDWQIAAPGLAEEDGLETAVIISLFTDRRAAADDILPTGDNRRGWWGDALAEIDGDLIGSRLWILSREKQLPAVVGRAREYAEEALRWLVVDGVASAVAVAAEVIRDEVLGLQVLISKPDGTMARYQFNRFWKGDANAV